MKTIHTVLVGIDFSQPSISALKEAQRISRQDKAALVALHTINQESLDDLRKHIDIVFEDVLTEASAKLDDHLEEVLGDSHGIETKVAIGHPFGELRSEAEQRNADLVVIGSQGFGDTPNRVGTLAGRCIRKLPQNVLLVRGRHGKPFRKIAACVDFSDSAFKATLHAAHLARQDHAPLELFHMHEPLGARVVDLGGMDFDVHVGQELQNKETERIMSVLSSSADTLANDHGIECGAKVVQDTSVKQAIEDTYGGPDCDTDLLVVSTRGRSGLKSLLLGTVAEKIIHISPCSVLVVKPEGFDFKED